jgi:hypothetical protein
MELTVLHHPWGSLARLLTDFESSSRVYGMWLLVKPAQQGIGG